MEVSLYFHVPFCAGLCDYCDFYSVLSKPTDPRLDRFVDRCLEDLETIFKSHPISRVPSVYLGGGTPSLLGGPRLSRLLGGIRALLPSVPDEWTVEANPESVDDPFLRSCLDGGVTRLSLGIQSFNAPSRLSVGRIGTVEAARNALCRSVSVFGTHVSVDLIAGLPYQSADSLVSDLDEILESGASHVSLYSLTVEDGTPLAQKKEQGTVELPSPEGADDLWILGRDRLISRGLQHYEVSNFAVPGLESLHNMRYWRMESWIGIGPSASTTLVDEAEGTAVRRSVGADVGAYIQGRPIIQQERIDRRTLMEEMIMMGLRTTGGIDEGRFFSRFGWTAEALIADTLHRWRSRSLAHPSRPALTEGGLLLLNQFLKQALEELEAKVPSTPGIPGGFTDKSEKPLD